MNITDLIKEYLTNKYDTIEWDKGTNILVLDGKEQLSDDIKKLKAHIVAEALSKYEMNIKDSDISKPLLRKIAVELSVTDTPTEEEIPMNLPKPKEWQIGMDVTDKGFIIDSALNNTLLFEQHPCFKDRLYYDEIFQTEMYEYEKDGETHRIVLDDTGLSKLKIDVEKLLGGNRSPVNIKTAAIGYCIEHRKNTLLENIHNLKGKAKGTKNLEEFFIKAYECDDTPYIRYVTKVLFYSWLKRMMNPGCACDYMFVFEGEQGIGKSKLLPRMIKLLGGRGTENMKFNNDRNSLEMFSTYQLCQSEELKDMKKAELSIIKDLISRTQDTFDKKYRSTKSYLRSCIIVGNVNPEDKNFLKDLADYERRFIIFPCKAEGYPHGIRCKGDWWEKNFPDEYLMKIWAEAYWMVENEPDFLWLSLPKEIAKELKEIQTGRKAILMDDVFLDKLRDTLDLPFYKDSFESYDDFVTAVESAKISSKNQKSTKQINSIPKNIWRRYVKDVLREDRSLTYFDKGMELIGWKYVHTTVPGEKTPINIYEYRRVSKSGEQLKLIE